MYLESIALTNFQCFGRTPRAITFDRKLTALLGLNASGKTAVMQALLRLFSVVDEQREVKLTDFHVPKDETEAPATRKLRIDVVFSFPELEADEDQSNLESVVPEFFPQMSADCDGKLKFRVVLDATWTADGSAEGLIEVRRRIAFNFEDDIEDESEELRASDRNRIQVIYVPATRDGVRQVNSFLRSRLWRAATWSGEFREHIEQAAEELSEKFREETAVEAVVNAIGSRWQELHHLPTEMHPTFEPIARDLTTLVRNAEMFFEPAPTGRKRSTLELSDGQRSLLHLSLTTATLDLESEVVNGKHPRTFDIEGTSLPALTILAVEEPENNLAPFFLSRVVEQLESVTGSHRAQAILSSHSASVMARITPDRVRHFRTDNATGATKVTAIELPPNDSDAGKYLREAVLAHPELYFARFVILGEGESEELVIPKLSAARGLKIDQSFVAVIPLGGRHTNHFWKLLNQLDIPHATLLDLDEGRHGGEEGRIKYVCELLQDYGGTLFGEKERESGFHNPADVVNLNKAQIQDWIERLEKYGVFFSRPLDFDMMMLDHFGDAYTGQTDARRKGPSDQSDPRNAIFGSQADGPVAKEWDDESLRWYRYLFLSQSKPSSHLSAMTAMSPDELKDPPQPIRKLLDRVEEVIEPACS